MLIEHDAWRSGGYGYDGRTGLPNRALFEERLNGAINRASGSQQAFALALARLEGTRAIGERYGVRAVTELSVRMGGRLLKAVSAADSVVHLRDDEFAILLERLDDASAPSIEHLAETLASIASEAVTLSDTRNGRPVAVVPQLNLGMAVFPRDGRTRSELLGCVDQLMNKARRSDGRVRTVPVRLPETRFRTQAA